MEARDERERWLNGNIPHDRDPNPIVERVLGLRDIGSIVLEGLADAAKDGVRWLGDKAVRAVETLDDSLDVFGSDDD